MKFKDEYLKSGAFCPFCKSHEIEGGPVDIVGTSAFQNVKCIACGASWQDEYWLVDAVSVESSSSTTPTE
jgi:transcription elongation factor Elf1